ncbi:hypothetical protein MYP_890 [Sporocytophaga myxococcoides]|uniref:Indoleamine 2,3-dioxygenase n=1 Tax=Sporocytophaga myxococcoides TaxID=153721 RepID=A0A098LBE7_9BACT|nr:hypothetical protein [Sporocytophaga myxococcoides]GAL83663.1 hypothetical protein MYP_890 [Sporocytophaga myxococcoides]
MSPFVLTEQIQLFLKHPSFLPEKVPHTRLPAPFDIYVDLLNHVYLWNSKDRGGVRSFLYNALSEVSIDNKEIDALDYWEQEKLLSVLTLLAHCYRWNYLPPEPDEFLKQNMNFPHQLWQSLSYVADKLEHPHCGTLWSIMLMNFQVIEQAPGTNLQIDKVNFQDLSLAHNWVCKEFQGQLEHWIKIFIMTEVVGTTANKACMQVLKAIIENDKDMLGKALELLYESIIGITTVFNREVRGQKLNMAQWREHIQPSFVWGLKDPQSQSLLEGVSGLQLGCIQLMDLVLGLEMDSTMGRAMMASRKYFPKHSRDLLEALEPYRNKLKFYLKRKNDQDLNAKYNQCLEALESYRISHKQRGKAYIKGDGTSKSITTTGLSVQNSFDAIKQFDADMEERILETVKEKIIYQDLL